MRLVDKLVFKDLVGPFINGLGMFMLLIFAAAYMFPATEMLVKGVPPEVVGKIVLYSMPSVVTQTFPMAMLLAGLMAFGRLSADREAVALFATGISFFRAARAVLIMGVLVSVAAFVWNDTVVPPASRAYNDIKNQALKNLISTNKPMSYAIFGKDDVTIEQFIYIQGGFDSKNRTLHNVSITKYNTTDPKRAGQPEVFVYADRASVRDTKGLDWTYYNGYFTSYNPDPKTGEVNDSLPLNFDELKLLPYNASLGKNFDEVLVAEAKDNNQKSFGQLRAEIMADTKGGATRRGNEVDLYGKIALPLASLIFGIVGAALGVNTRRGGGKTVGFGMAIFIVFLYWVFYHAMFVVGKNGGLPPIIASFLADIVGAVAGIILALRASR